MQESMDYHTLTDRQRKILELLAAGKTNKEISAVLRITENTVEYHLVKRIYPILGVRTRSAASAVYLKCGFNAHLFVQYPESAYLAQLKSLNLQQYGVACEV